jgi:hypothetical protein
MGYVDDAFTNLRHGLEITATESKLASRRQLEIREVVGGKIDLRIDFLTGAYIRDTKTKPLQDVDIFFVINRDGRDADLCSAQPTDVLEHFRAALAARYGSAAVTIDDRCCIVSFGEEDVLSFDVVPAADRAQGGFTIPDRRLMRWIATDPKAHEDLGIAKNADTGGKWKPLVKMVKGWNRLAGGPINPSFLLEVMALELIDAPMGTYQDEVKLFFVNAADRIGEAWPDPAGIGPDVNTKMSASETDTGKYAFEQGLAAAERAIALEDRGDERAAVEEWRTLFGSRMPRPA